MMLRDPVVEEVWQNRDEYAKQFNYDLHGIYQDLKKKQEKSDRKVVSFPPKTTLGTDMDEERTHDDCEDPYAHDLLGRLFGCVDKVWSEEKLDVLSDKGGSVLVNPVTIPSKGLRAFVDVPLGQHYAYFRFGWVGPALAVTLTVPKQSGDAGRRPLNLNDKIVNHLKGAGEEVFRINMPQRGWWVIDIRGYSLPAAGAQAEIDASTERWDWDKDRDAARGFNVAYGELINKYQDLVNGILRKRLSRVPGVDEEGLFMIVWGKLIECNCRRLRGYKCNRASFDAFLGIVVGNIVTDELRHRRLSVESTADAEAWKYLLNTLRSPEPSPLQELSTQEFIKAVEEQLQQLLESRNITHRDRYRLTFRYSVWEGWKTAEIVDSLGIRPNAVSKIRHFLKYEFIIPTLWERKILTFNNLMIWKKHERVSNEELGRILKALMNRELIELGALPDELREVVDELREVVEEE